MLPATAALVLALATLVAWIILAFVVAIPSGIVHALLAVGVTLLIYWWAIRT